MSFQTTKKSKTRKKQYRALVTGGAGFIGSHLCEELLLRGYQVVCIDNLSTGSKNNIKHLFKNTDFSFHKCSILNKKAIAPLIKKCDVIFHLAAAVGVKLIIKNSLSSILTNVEGTANVLYFASKYHKKIILASSSEVYGKHPCDAIKEEDDRIIGSSLINRWSYSASKTIDEFLALGYAKVKLVLPSFLWVSYPYFKHL